MQCVVLGGLLFVRDGWPVAQTQAIFNAEPSCPPSHDESIPLHTGDPMAIVPQKLLEVTITHNLDDAEEVKELYRRRWIALDWHRKGPDPSAYKGRARTDVMLFNTIRQQGAAVIAAYKKATRDKPSRRLVGIVKLGAAFEDLNGLLCLPLSVVQIVDSSRGFLGNLAPRRCTVQGCGNRARGRLSNLVSGHESPDDVGLLHHHDVEWLVTNYLIVTGMCECVWSGGRSYEDIDHAGSMPGGRELLAQTTISASLVRKKAERLLKHASADRVLYLFGPEASGSHCPSGVIFQPIEKLIPRLVKAAGGRWLVSRMFLRSSQSGGK